MSKTLWRLGYTGLGLTTIALVAVALLVPAAARAAACPNEAVRLELNSGLLPDCRAYERVTPAYTDSAPLDGVFAVSSEGMHLIGGSLGAFGDTNEDALGNQENIFGAIYEFTRTSGQGWSVEAIGPSYAEFTGNGMFDASENLDATLWELGRIKITGPGDSPKEALCPKPGEKEAEEAQRPNVTDFFLERPTGVFRRVGPPTPNLCAPNTDPFVEYSYLGASSDLSHVLFSTNHGFHWGFDKTIPNGGTLYEYTGIEQSGELRVEQSGEPERKPMLVGVEGGPTSRELISHCGTRLGSSSREEAVNGSLYNAISASGKRIFFTAVGTEEAHEACEGPSWGELFAREEMPLIEGEASAASMRTISISQPTVEDCSRCIETKEPQAPAVFQGASRDGSKVFFTTEQALLPGAKGNNLYEYDFNAPEGERIKLLSGGSETAEVQGVARISEDGSHVYFVALGNLTGLAKNGVGDSAKAGNDNLYVYSEGHTAFVATLEEPRDSADWAQADNRPVLTSENGDYLVFPSAADLTNEGLNGRSQIFQYDAPTDALVRVSIGEYGFNEDDRTPEVGSTLMNHIPQAYTYNKVDSPTTATGIQIPSDGAVFFSSPDALTLGALHDHRVKVVNEAGEINEDPVPNIYEYRAGNVYLLSDGHDTSVVNSEPGVSLVGWDPSGQDVFFFTSDPLIPSDTNTQQDLYDARAEGGFPVPPSPTGCGEMCQGPLGGVPSLAPLGGSATETAEAETSQPLASPTTVSKPKPTAKAVKKKKKKMKKAKKRSTGKASRRSGHESRTR